MSTTDEACELLREICRTGKLQHTKEVCESEDVVMHPDGSLAYTNGNDKKNTVNRTRKQLVLGLDGHDEHSLSEANSIVSGRPPRAD